MGRPTRIAELVAFDRRILFHIASELVSDGPFLKASAAEDAEHDYDVKEEDGFLGDLSDLCGEMGKTGLTIAGFDEAGRGALAGPVVVGCVHFPPFLPSAEDAKNAESSDRGKTLGDLCGERKECLVSDGTFSGASTGRARKERKKERFLCGRGALCGEMKGTTDLRFESIFHALAWLDDSKRLSSKKREGLFDRICALSKWGIGCASSSEIDQIGIAPALTLAAKRAYRAMGCGVDLLLLDRGLSLRERPSSKAATAEHYYKKEGSLCDLRGERKETEIAITKGDARSLHIAAASVLAKVSRDRMMARLAVRFPDYDLDHNKGYGTATHRCALQRLGPSPIHRRSFRVR